MPLYVFLHGLTAVRQQGTDLEIVLPRVPGHVQKAGRWLAESDIAQNGVLELSGVETGNAPFPWDGMLFLKGTTLTTRKRAATLRLPRPEKVFGLLYAFPTLPPYPPRQPLPASEDYVVRTKAGGTVFKNVASVHVLVYDYRDENEVRLDGHSWEPDSNDGAISLHVISTSEEPEGQAHEDETENVMQQILQGYPGLEFRKNPRPLAAPWIDPHHPYYNAGTLRPQGDHMFETATAGARPAFAFALAELEHPAARRLRLGRLGTMIRSQRPIGGLWRSPDVLGDRVSNCATTGTT
jgi:hypothetical protein